ncbi:patched domain-containing protein 3-like [Haliotis cracherodii]|uniref:patched domain-containing protein 3-like n=1 Tax=Haliotis cracherodii TaxID=6455 RepID=UPI0039E99E59
MGCYSASAVLYNRLQRWYGERFNSYGQFVGRHEVVFIVLPLLVFGLLGLGILKMEYESDVERLYTPINSQAAQDRDKMKASFPDRTGTNYNTYSLNVEDRYGEIIAISEGNIFSNTSTGDMRNLVDTIKQFEVDFEGRTLHYSDVCARASDVCVISGGFLLQDDFLSSLEQRNVTYPLWNDVDISFFVSGVNVSGEVLQSASVMKLTFHLRHDNDTMQEYALLWEDAFISNMSSLSATFFPIGVSFATSQSLGDELNENTNGDVFWFSLSFTLLITYASFVSGGDCVSSKSHVTRAGVMAAGFGILGSFGLMSLCGVKFVNIVGIMPFLVLSVGVDDMFLMVSAWADTNQYGDDWDIPKRLGHTFRLAGIGMTITSLTDLVAFLVGYSSVFLSVKNFCLYTGTAIIFSYIAQMTFLAGCLAVHGHRVENSRHCVTCQPVLTEEELKEKSCMFRCSCSGKPPRDREDSLLERLPPLILNKYLLTIGGKVLTILMFLTYVGVSLWGVTKLEQGLFLENLVPPTSYYSSYSINNYKFYGTRIPVSFVMTKNTNYYDENVTGNFQVLFQKIGNDDNMNNATQICGLLDYVNSPYVNRSSASDFVTNFKSFINANSYAKNDVVFSDSANTITALRCHMISMNVPDSMDQANLMLRMRHLAAESPLPVFPYHPTFIFFEQFVSVLPTVLQTLGIAVAVMVILTALFLPHPLIVGLVCINILTILLGIFGFMSLWGLSLSSITMIHLIMSVGFSIDFTVHVSTAYMLAKGKTRDERVKHAIIHAAGPIFNGGFSTFIGILTLVRSQSYVFQSFFKIMIFVIVFGMGNAVLLMPVILSLVGPMPKGDHPSPHNLSEQGDKNIYKVGDECAPGSASRSTSSVSTINRSELASTGSFAVSNVGYVSTNVT